MKDIKIVIPVKVATHVGAALGGVAVYELLRTFRPFTRVKDFVMDKCRANRKRRFL